MFFDKHKKNYSMNDSMAEETLKNVFSACDIHDLVQQASVKELKEKHLKETSSFRRWMTVSIAILVLVLLMPFAFARPKQKVTSDSAGRIGVLQHHAEEGMFYLTLTGDDIDFDHVEIICADGSNRIPFIEKESSTLSFTYNNEELNLFIPNKAGSTCHILISPKN